MLVDRHDAVAAADLAGGVEQQQGGRITGAQGLGGADHRHLDAEVVALAIVAVVARILAPRRIDHCRVAVQAVRHQVGIGRIVLVEAAEHVAGPHDRPALARLALQAAHVKVLADGAAQAVLFQADHVGRGADRVGIHHPHVFQEHLQLAERNRRHRLAFAMHAGLQPQARAVDEGQVEHVAGIDQVGIAHLRVGLPDLRPQPRLGQEFGGDVPQGVATANGVAVGVIGTQLRARGIDGQGDQHAGQQHDCLSDHWRESPFPRCSAECNRMVNPRNWRGLAKIVCARVLADVQ